MQDPIDAHYEMLKTDISVLEETSEDFKVGAWSYSYATIFCDTVSFRKYPYCKSQQNTCSVILRGDMAPVTYCFIARQL